MNNARKVPHPRVVTMSPSLLNVLSARMTVARPTSYCADSSATVGSLSPVAHSPASKRSRSSRVTR